MTADSAIEFAALQYQHHHQQQQQQHHQNQQYSELHKFQHGGGGAYQVMAAGDFYQDVYQQGERCKVCYDFASGTHFGVLTCEGCKGFFKRNHKEQSSKSGQSGNQQQQQQQQAAALQCPKDKKCEITASSRNTCRYCRYQKCLKVGMSRDAIKLGRRSKKEKVFLNKDLEKSHQRQHHHHSLYPVGTHPEVLMEPTNVNWMHNALHIFRGAQHEPAAAAAAEPFQHQRIESQPYYCVPNFASPTAPLTPPHFAQPRPINAAAAAALAPGGTSQSFRSAAAGVQSSGGFAAASQGQLSPVFALGAANSIYSSSPNDGLYYEHPATAYNTIHQFNM